MDTQEFFQHLARLVKRRVETMTNPSANAILASSTLDRRIQSVCAAAAKIREVFAGPLGNGSFMLEQFFSRPENINAIK
jgi:hypothetical protein